MSKVIVSVSETDDAILGFSGEYRFLSNFYPCAVNIQNVNYPSSEHAYQAMKSVRTRDRRWIAHLENPRDAKAWASGDQIVLRPNWDSIRVEKMTNVLRCKFIQNKPLRLALIATRNRYLEETNWWNDTFWGVCNGTGENTLGRLLMELRKDLR